MIRSFFAAMFMVMSHVIIAQEIVRVAVAANLSRPIEEIIAEYENGSDSKVEMIIASSGALTAQIRNNAPFHVFISADLKYISFLEKQKLVLKSTTIAFGHLTFWSLMKMDPLDLKEPELIPELDLIAIANYETAPYGDHARLWLEENGIWESIESRLVYAENVGGVNRYIYSRSVQAAFTAVSATKSKELNGKGFWSPLNTGTGIPHPAALTRYGKSSVGADDFFKYLSSQTARDILSKYGYTLP